MTDDQVFGERDILKELSDAEEDIEKQTYMIKQLNTALKYYKDKSEKLEKRNRELKEEGINLRAENRSLRKWCKYLEKENEELEIADIPITTIRTTYHINGG